MYWNGLHCCCEKNDRRTGPLSSNFITQIWTCPHGANELRRSIERLHAFGERWIGRLIIVPRKCEFSVVALHTKALFHLVNACRWCRYGTVQGMTSGVALTHQTASRVRCPRRFRRLATAGRMLCELCLCVPNKNNWSPQA